MKRTGKETLLYALGVLVMVLFLTFLAQPVADATGFDLRNRDHFIVLLFVVAIIVYAISAIQKRLYYKDVKYFEAIADNNEKIRELEDYISNSKQLSKEDSKLSVSLIALKIALLNLLAYCYMENDDYNAALKQYEKTSLLAGRMDPLNKKTKKLDIRENSMIGEAQCLAHIGELTGARRKFTPVMQRIDVLDQVNRLNLLLASVEVDTAIGEIESARTTVNNMLPELNELALKHNMPDIRYDGVLLDAIVEKAEGKTDSARVKFEEITRYCGNHGNVVRAKKELKNMEVSINALGG